MASETKPQVLLANAQSETSAFIQELIDDLGGYELVRVDDLVPIIEGHFADLKPILCIFDAQSENSDPVEWMQSLKMAFASPILVIHGSQVKVDFPTLKKNGADQMIHFHFDQEFIADLILEMAPIDYGKEVPLAALNSIDLQEIHPEMETNFDVYIHLPSNQKSILLRKKGSLIEERVLEKVRSAKQHLYFKKTETKFFLEYARTSLTLRNAENVTALTEKLIKSKRKIFEIMSEFFNSETNNFETGKSILERCRQIVNEFNLLKPKTISEAVEQMALISGNTRTFYHDAINVANFSALIGHILGLDIGKVESLALAGLLHNIGLADLSGYKPGMDLSILTKDQLLRYQHYPSRSVQMVKNQRVPLPNEVSFAIEQHQENQDGTGFPNNLSNEKINDLAKIVKVALRFQELTALSKDKSAMTFKNAIESLKSEVTSGHSNFDIGLIMNLFKKTNF